MNDDNNNNEYERNFIESVKAASRAPAQNEAPVASSNRFIYVITPIILGCIVLIETVALVILAINNTTLTDEELGEEYEIGTYDDSPEALSQDSIYSLDDDYNITAFDLTCVADDGSSYSFTKSKTYQKKNPESITTDSGTYSVLNGSAVILNSSNNPDTEKTVYYDSYYIIEGLTFYSC